jgi:hypothetical protein
VGLAKPPRHRAGRRAPAGETSGYGGGRPSLTIEFGPSPHLRDRRRGPLPDGPFGEDPADRISHATAVSTDSPLATKNAHLRSFDPHRTVS